MRQGRDRWRDRPDGRWDRRDGDRDDWHDWADHRWRDHRHWHHGYWHGHYDGWWRHMWYYHPFAFRFGLTIWGVNRLNYWFGYWPYYNPYFVQPFPVSPSVIIDYSQPLVVYEQQAAAAPAPAAGAEDPGMAAFDAARDAFLAGNYEAALQGVNKALSYRPDDAVLHEFRALVMFATGQYRDAAAALHAVLAVGPGWDWTTLSGLYPSVDVYTGQLRRLEKYTAENPQAADARFVLAYHYLTCGYSDAAAAQLTAVLQLEPKDEVAAQLLEMIAGPEAVPDRPEEPPPAPAADVDAEIPAEELVGTWTAAGRNGDRFSLQLSPQGEFTWTYSSQGKATVISGVYALEGTELALEPDEGGVMLATITPPQNNAFQFRVVGSPPEDNGLEFRKSP